MTFAISVTALIEAIALVYFGLVILEIRYKMNNVYPELMKIIGEQNNILLGNLDALNRWSDLSTDIISHIERVEDMEGDIKDIFEWIHSVDNNVAGMRYDIQETDTKLGDLMAVHDRNVRTFSNDLQSLQKDITEIKASIDTNACWIRSEIESVDPDGDISTNIISGRGNYRQFLSSSDKDMDTLYKEIVVHAMRNRNAILEGEDEDDNNRTE